MNILYICTHNRCRSIIAEAVTNLIAGGQLITRSAGSEPAGFVHPLTLKYLQEAGVPTQHLHSKSWHDVNDFTPDLVITVCDSAAEETCPLWLGDVVKVHWGLKDPSKVQGTERQVTAAFRHCINEVKHRVTLMLDAGVQHAQKDELQKLMQELGAR